MCYDRSIHHAARHPRRVIYNYLDFRATIRGRKPFAMPNQTPKPLNIEKLTLPLSAIQAMGSAQRSALLLLGLFLNEVNWLRKLLARSVSAPSLDEPEEQANFALTVLLATTLVGKVHEGWDRIIKGNLYDTLERLRLIPLSQVDQYLGLADRIRNGAGFDSFGRS
jgi:hypothetical protein